jgi:twinkle protein
MNAAEIKQALNDRALDFAAWLFPLGKRDGVNWRVGSLAGERGQSFAVCVAGAKVGVFADFATGEAGDNLVELYAQARQVAFPQALRVCSDWLGVSFSAPVAHRSQPESRASVVLSPGSPLPVPMTDYDNQRALEMAAQLRDDFSLCERIACGRNWNPKTIHELAYELSLGWNEGKLAFLYESGVKLRWRQNGERLIRWAFGQPWLWRGGFLWSHEIVFVTEGETDAVSLIDAGLERDGSTVAVAVPSASTFNSEWAALFAGKDVILSFDSDDAGRHATAKVSRLLAPVAKTLKQLDWKGLQHAS